MERGPFRLAAGSALALAIAAAVLGSHADAAPRTVSGTFNVAAQVNAGCALTTNKLNFTSYAINQVTPALGSTTFNVACPGVGTTAPSHPIPVTFTFSTNNNQFLMRQGATGLAYELCNDAACTQVYRQNVAGPSVSVTSTSFDYTLYGEIFGGQPVGRGTYSQSVKVVMTF